MGINKQQNPGMENQSPNWEKRKGDRQHGWYKSKNHINTQVSAQQGNKRQELATKKRTITAHGKL